MRFLYNNLVDSATLTSDGVTPGFELDNVKDIRLSRFFRSNGAADNIVIDLGSPKAVDTLCLGAHNISTTGTITLQGNATNAWGAPTKTESITVTPTTLFATFTAATLRYWRVVIVDLAGPGQVQIGRIGVGKFLQGPQVGLNVQLPSRSTTQIAYSRGRQSYINEGVRYKACSFQFNYFDSTDKAAFEAMFEYSDIQPVFVDFEELSDGPYYANVSGEFDFSYVGNGDFYTLNMDFEEVF